MWRAQVFADCTLATDESDKTSLPAHRAILASRTEYFRSLLSDDFGDSHLRHFSLPSPLFTTASLTWILGFIYSGTLSFSTQTLELSTAFDIWRGSLFLGINSLQSDVELHLERVLTTKTAARIFTFALAPDVNSSRLAAAAGAWVHRDIDDVWNSSLIGDMEFDQQKAIVRGVRQSLNHDNIVPMAGRVLRLRRRLETARAPWAEHVRAMLEAVEGDLIKALSDQLAAVVLSRPFVQLMDGVGFSTDRLEYVMSLIIRGLTEQTAPVTYSVIATSILRRDVSGGPK